MASTVRSHRADPGSIPGIGALLFSLGEREYLSIIFIGATEDEERLFKLGVLTCRLIMNVLVLEIELKTSERAII